MASGGGGWRQDTRVILDRVLGKGTFSTVYEALVVPGNKRIALKIVHLSAIIDDRKTVNDCINEIHVLKVGGILET